MSPAVTNGQAGEPQKKGRAARKLRSKETPKVNSSLFNYEENPNTIDGDQKLYISESLENGELLKSGFTIDKESFNFVTNLKVIDNTTEDEKGKSVKRRKLRKSTTTRPTHDPLNDELYQPYNRRMEKEEKKMINWEREKIYSEADKMKSQLESLRQNDWIRVLPTITYIRDPRDHKELQDKKKWTIESLEMLLKRFDSWKKLEEKVLGRTRAPSPAFMHDPFRYYTSSIDNDLLEESDTDEEENRKTLDEIRKHRRRKKIARYGPIIKVKFGNRVIIAEPFKATRIEYQ